MTAPSITRFYKEVSVIEDDGLFCVALDGRIARTTGRNALGAPAAALAAEMADEWDAQEEKIILASMPLSRLQGFVLDGGDDAAKDAHETVLNYAQSDLLAYRSDVPKLAARQAEVWQPVLDLVGSRFGGEFTVTATVISVTQPPALVAGIDKFLSERSHSDLLVLKLWTEILGSAALGLAVFEGLVPADVSYAASRVDEVYQTEQWGIDAEAAAREALILADFEVIERFLALTRVPN